MHSLTRSAVFKACVVVLYIISTAIFVCSLFITVLLAEKGFYSSSEYEVLRDIFENITSENCSLVGDMYATGTDPKVMFEETNFSFIIYSEDGEILQSTVSDGVDYSYMSSIRYPIYEESVYEDMTGSSYFTEKYSGYIDISGYVVGEMQVRDRYSIVQAAVFTVYKGRFTIPAIGAVFLLTSVLSYVFLIMSCGKKKESDEIVLSTLNKLPFDLYSLIFVSFAVIQAVLMTLLRYSGTLAWKFVSAAFFEADLILLMIYSLGIAVRVKKGVLLENLIIVKIYKASVRTVVTAIRKIPFIWRTVVSLIIVFTVEYLGIINTSSDTGLLVFWFIRSIIIFVIIVKTTFMIKSLFDGCERISRGELSYRIKTQDLTGIFKKHGENLNNINFLVSDAVDKKLKSERFKAELITNVSHDIKTPLTSIISYTDLIKRRLETDVSGANDQLFEYIDVLDRQSAKLKKLLEDLVEVSKAATGNININLVPCEICVLLAQTTGEYKDKLASRDLELILQLPDEHFLVVADGKYLWRVFDNLLSNVYKYALLGTRVYFSLTRENDMACVILKNISKIPLSLTSEEYIERFTREDISRNTEGSGLGLSIAKSFVELQQGIFKVVTDGDLFKVEVMLKIIG